jgi:hypothetical protein
MKLITRRGSGRDLVAKGRQRMLPLIGAALVAGTGLGAFATVFTVGAASARAAAGAAASSTAVRSGVIPGPPRAAHALGQSCEIARPRANTWISGTVINETGLALKLKYEEIGVLNHTVFPGIAKEIRAGGTDKWCVHSPFGSGVVIEYSFGSGDTFRFDASTYPFGSGYEGCKVYETNNSGSYACTAIRAKAGEELSDLTFRLFRVRPAAGSATSRTALPSATTSGHHCKYQKFATNISGTVINETGLPLKLRYEEYGFANTASPPAAQVVAAGETNNWCVYSDLAGSGVVIEYSFGSDVFRFDASTYVNFTGSEGCAVYESSNSRSYACTAIRAKAGERLSYLTFRLFRVR